MAYNTKIPLFRRWVLQNFPFIEQDFDALTDYQLICKVVEYLNKVIEVTNETTGQVELLTTALDHEYNRLPQDDEETQKKVQNSKAATKTLRHIFTLFKIKNITSKIVVNNTNSISIYSFVT